MEKIKFIYIQFHYSKYYFFIYLLWNINLNLNNYELRKIKNNHS
jgi:hypothetical protein